MNKKDFRKFVIEEVRNIMAGKIKKTKFSSFKDDFDVFPKRDKLVVWKQNKNVEIDKGSIKYLIMSLDTITKTETKSVAGKVKLSDYDSKKRTIKYSGVTISVDVVRQLERVWINHFGEY